MQILVPRDAGNALILSDSDPSDIRLQIRTDVAADHKQWFYFRVAGAKGQAVTIHLTNASECSYAKAWNGYTAATSIDGVNWGRIQQTSYDEGVLTLRFTPASDNQEVAYFAPYALERHDTLISAASSVSGVRSHVLGYTINHEPLQSLHMGEGSKHIWIIARQHPGESMAEWFMEGLIERLTHSTDALARKLLQNLRFHLVPNMNPDGSRLGNLRTNAAGANLNRQWHAPTMEHSPEVKLVLDAMDRTGCHLCIDVHGDEELPYNFISGAEGVPGWDEARQQLQEQFIERYVEVNPDFQREFGYGVDAANEANMTMCTNQIAHRFGCLAMTLEQPFKDTANTPMPLLGWTPQRAKALGASCLDAISHISEKL